MKKIAAITLPALLVFSIATPAFADEVNNPTVDPSYNTASEAQIPDAADPVKLAEVLNSGITVDQDNPSSVHYFEDGSSIIVNVGVSETPSANKGFSAAAVSSQKTASVEIVGRGYLNNLLFSYALHQNYRVTNGKISWHEASPYTTITKNITSMWAIEAESMSVTDNPGYPGGLWSTASAKLRAGLWELPNLDQTNVKLTLSIKANGDYEGYARYI